LSMQTLELDTKTGGSNEQTAPTIIECATDTGDNQPDAGAEPQTTEGENEPTYPVATGEAEINTRRAQTESAATATGAGLVPPEAPKDKPGEESLEPWQKSHLKKQLRRREEIIKQGDDAWWACAMALMEIRDQRLYRVEGFTDFGEYAKKRLRMGKSTITRRIATAEVWSALAPVGAKKRPKSERQLRPLLKLRKPDQEPAAWGKTVAEVWAKAVQSARILKKPLTEKIVHHALQELGLEEPKPKQECGIEFNVEKRWADLLAYLEDEREFWPSEHRRYLSEHMAALVRFWETGMQHLVFEPVHPKSVITENWDKPPTPTTDESKPASPRQTIQVRP
jgi:hypothetical protein